MLLGKRKSSRMGSTLLDCIWKYFTSSTLSGFPVKGLSRPDDYRHVWDPWSFAALLDTRELLVLFVSPTLSRESPSQPMLLTSPGKGPLCSLVGRSCRAPRPRLRYRAASTEAVKNPAHVNVGEDSLKASDQGRHEAASERGGVGADLTKNEGSSRPLDIDHELHDTLRSVLWKFKAPIRFAFAYGSGVFPQKGYSSSKGSSKPMVDFIFGVSYAQHFHSLNLNNHWDHYSFLRRLGSGAVSHVQKNYGAGVYFNPYVEVNGIMIKYGVVLIDDLCRDLTDWKTLYLAGRMQKPIKVLRDNAQVRMASQRNLYSAVRTALLLLPEIFTQHELYTTIAGLSYTGDPRMTFGENPKKVENIVTAQFSAFSQLYEPFIERLPNVSFNASSAASSGDMTAGMSQDLDPTKRGNMVRRLPANFRANLYYQYRRRLGAQASLQADDDAASTMPYDDRSPYGTAFDRQIAADRGLAEEVRRSIKATVSWPSTAQSIKGILTAGPFKSWSYVNEKLKKARQKK